MKPFRHRKYHLYFLFVLLLLSACQPIQPLPSAASSACTDADKTALMQAYVGGMNNDSATETVAPFTEDGQITLDSPPIPNPDTGKYFVPGLLEFPNVEAMTWLAQFFIDAGGSIENLELVKINGNDITMKAVMNSPLQPIFGSPDATPTIVYTAKLVNCKIAHLTISYPEEELIALEAVEKKANSECTNLYKSQVFQQYLVGVSNGDITLAMLPWAKDAVAEFDSAPVFDEATQAYVQGEQNQWSGKDAIKQMLESLISLQFTKTYEPLEFKIIGNMIEAPVITSSPSFASDFNLPLTDLDSFYVVEFGENCRIEHISHTFTDAALTKLKEAKTK